MLLTPGMKTWRMKKTQKWLYFQRFRDSGKLNYIAFFTAYLVTILKASLWRNSTVEDGQKISKNKMGEHKVITPEQQFLGIILCIFKMAVAIAFLCKNAVEAI